MYCNLKHNIRVYNTRRRTKRYGKKKIFEAKMIKFKDVTNIKIQIVCAMLYFKLAGFALFLTSRILFSMVLDAAGRLGRQGGSKACSVFDQCEEENIAFIDNAADFFTSTVGNFKHFSDTIKWAYNKM